VAVQKKKRTSAKEVLSKKASPFMAVLLKNRKRTAKKPVKKA